MASPIITTFEATISYVQAQTTTIPYDFEPYPLVTSTHQIIPDFTTVPFVNALGSTALTLFSMLDAFSVLGIIVVILLAMKVVWWLYGFVTNKPVEESVIDISGAVEIITTGRTGRNPYK